MKISVVHPFYNHNGAIPAHLLNWNEWTKETKTNTEIIIVDDGSPEPINLDLFKNVDLDIKVFRVLKDIKWNVTGARNLGIIHASGDWILALDFDMGALDATFQGFFKEKLIPQVLYWPNLWFPSKNRPNRMRHPHCNSFFINREIIMKTGLYDEDFAGEWGWEDIFVHDCLFPSLGLTKKVMDEGYIRWFRGFACKTQHGEIVSKNPKNMTTNNYTMMLKKIEQVENHTYKNGPILRFPWERIK